MSGLNVGSGAITGVYVGSTPATAVYLGSEQVWSAAPSDPYLAAVLADSPDLAVRLDSTTPTDLSGNGHTVAAYGSPAPVVSSDADLGSVVGAGAFYTDAILGQSAYTLEGVAVMPSTSDYLGLVGSWQNAGAMICTYSSTGQVGPAVSTGVRGSAAASTGDWHHYAATWDGTDVRFYIDGVATSVVIGSTTAPGLCQAYGGAHPSVAGAIIIGTYQGDQAQPRWVANMHSVATYSHALTAARVAAHATAIGL